MPLTKAEIRDRAATDLGRLGLNRSLQDQDKVRIESGYDEVYAQLRKDGLATWPSTGSTPDEIVPHLIALVADNCLNTYGVSIERYNRIKAAAGFEDGDIAKKAIRKLVSQDYVSQVGADDF